MEDNNKGYVLINLMPYREKIKLQKIRNLGIILSGFVALSGALVFSLYSLVSLETDTQIERNEYISKENKKLDNDIKEIANLKEEIKQTLAKRKVVEDLQVDRSDVVNILNTISNQLPDGTSIKSIKQVDTKITIVGLTQSNNKVSNYMTNLEKNQFFTNAELVEIKAIPNPVKKPNAKVAEDQNFSEFTINVYLTPKVQAVDPKDKKTQKALPNKAGEKK